MTVVELIPSPNHDFGSLIKKRLTMPRPSAITSNYNTYETKRNQTITLAKYLFHNLIDYMKLPVAPIESTTQERTQLHHHCNQQDEMIRAARYGNLKKVESLLDEEAVDINGKNYDGRTALHLASYHGHKTMVNFLLFHGADPEVRDMNSYFTALMLACENRHNETAYLLLIHGANIDSSDMHGYTCLHKACFYGEYALAQLLLSRGGNVNVANQKKQTPLHFACYHGCKALCTLLLQKGADMNLKDVDGGTPLDVANARGFFYLAQLLSGHKDTILLTDVGRVNQSVSDEVKRSESEGASLDQRPTLKMHALEQRCIEGSDGQDVESFNEGGRANSSIIRYPNNELVKLLETCKELRDKSSQNNRKNTELAKLLDNCRELQEIASQNNRDFQEALKNMERKIFRNNMFLALLVGIFLMTLQATNIH